MSDVKLVDGRLAARFAGCGRPSAALLVLIHGGGYTGRYFDVPPASLVSRACDAGFDVLTVDRPGHGGSPPLPDGPDLFERNATTICQGVEELLAGRENQDVVLVGHSIGGAIAVLMAARNPAWLRGVAASGFGLRPNTMMARRLRPIRQWLPRVGAPRRAKQRLVFGPPGSFDPTVAKRQLTEAGTKALTAELIEIASGWPTYLADAASQVRVPVDLRLAEYDALWESTPSAVAAFGELFTASPAATSELYPGVGHCIDHHRAGAEFHARQLAFARRCVGQDESSR